MLRIKLVKPSAFFDKMAGEEFDNNDVKKLHLEAGCPKISMM